MDSKGYWHDSEEAAREATKTDMRQRFKDAAADMPTHPQITIAVGERVLIVKDNGEQVYGTFDGAEKNKVLITPVDGDAPRPYLDTAEHVQLTRATGESVKAQVWDNRNGKIILRTLPI